MKIHLAFQKLGLFVLSTSALAIVACSHPGGIGSPAGSGGSTGGGTGGSSGDCTPGTELCACLSGNTCLNSLVCADDVNKCVSVDGGGSPGTGGTSPGTGGSSPGTGGTSPGTGGSSPGTGGNSGGGGNLIANGDFSQNDTDWHFESGTASVSNGQYCETNLSGASPLFGWQNTTTPLVLSASQQYTLSYQASGSGGAVLHVKVADALASNNYMPDDYETNPDDQISGSLQTFTHTFTPASTDNNTGVAFFVMSGQGICIANVSLVAN